MQAAATSRTVAAHAEKDVPSLRELIREDAQAAFERDPSADSIEDITRFSVGFKIVRAYRHQHWLYEHGHRTLALWLAMRSRTRYGADIHPAAQIGRRFTIDHGIGVVIGGTAIIGDDCLMYQGATLGMTGKHGGKRHPTLTWVTAPILAPVPSWWMTSRPTPPWSATLRAWSACMRALS